MTTSRSIFQRRHLWPLLTTIWVLYLLFHYDQGWILYDQFRDMWGAAKILCGGQIPAAGGAAAGLNVASPLFSWLLALPLAVDFSETAPALFVCLLFGGAMILGSWLMSRSTELKSAMLLLLLASWYRVFDLRSSMDQIVLAGFIIVVAHVFEKMVATASPQRAFFLGLLLSLAPHIHASGIFVVAVGTLLFWEQRQKLTRAHWAAFMVGIALPLMYWLFGPIAVDTGRGFPFHVNPVEWVHNWYWIIRHALGLDRYILQQVGLPGVLWPLYRLLVLLPWLWVLNGIKQFSPLRLVLLTGIGVAILGRSDYVLGTQWLILLCLAIWLIPDQQQFYRVTVLWILVAILAQAAIAVPMQERAVAEGWYKMPLAYMTMEESRLPAVAERSMLMIPTALLRRQVRDRALAAGERSFLDPERAMNLSASLAFANTGMLHLKDLQTGACGVGAVPFLSDPILMKYPAVHQPLFDILSFQRFALSDLIGTRIFSWQPEAEAENTGAYCVFGDFIQKLICPACLELQVHANPEKRRSTLALSCFLPPDIPPQLRRQKPATWIKDLH